MNEPHLNYGITYTAWGDKAIVQAIRSAKSVAQFNYPTCLITDFQYDSIDNEFDHVIYTDKSLNIPTQKVFYYNLTPFDVTLYLDTDTIVINNIDFGFEAAKKHGIALTFAPATSFAEHWGLSYPSELPQYNGGVIFHSKKHHLYGSFWDWVEEAIRKEYPDIDDRGRNPAFNDQSAMSAIIYERNISPYVLPYTWNLRPDFLMTAGFGLIRIWHSPHPPVNNVNRNAKKFWSLPLRYKLKELKLSLQQRF